MERESRTLEYKEKITQTFLKTVSAYANYNDGTIMFGVSDDGRIIGIDDPIATCVNIENMINDSIDPKPDFRLDIDKKNKTITLYVFEGIDKPYCYKNKAYKRNDSVTAPVDRLEFTRLSLEGQNLSYEQLGTNEKNLSFHILEDEFKDKLKIDNFDNDTLKTLELINSKSEPNNAAAILADKNSYNVMDIVRFGDSMDEISERVTISKVSAIEAYNEAIKVFIRYYRKEKIIGDRREIIEMIPEKAYREAVANAIVHRTWDVNGAIQIGMYKDKVEITSPGGLPSNISEEEYIRGRVSVQRNPIIAGVFARLGIIEKFGTGIKRINACYKSEEKKPEYEIYENSITVILPILGDSYRLDTNERTITKLLSPNKVLTRLEIEELSGMEKTKVVRILNNLIDKRIIEKLGSGRGTKYALKI